MNGTAPNAQSYRVLLDRGRPLWQEEIGEKVTLLGVDEQDKPRQEIPPFLALQKPPGKNEKGTIESGDQKKADAGSAGVAEDPGAVADGVTYDPYREANLSCRCRLHVIVLPPTLRHTLLRGATTASTEKR